MAAYEVDETLRPYRVDFDVAVPEALDVVLTGLLSR